ncbi:MAG: hypothetical protein V4474_04355 [Patescibacteria group bacterium]
MLRWLWRDYPRPDEPRYCTAVEQDIDLYLYDSYSGTVKEDSYTERERIGKKRWRTTLKTEEFAWKDVEAAKKADKPLEEWLLRPVAGDFKLRFYWLSRTIEAYGVPVGIKSIFRDDYRQSLIKHGTRARVGYSRHGGSQQGGVGRAIDVAIRTLNRGTQTARNSELIRLIDKFGPHFGIRRPMPSYDPFHVESGVADDEVQVAANTHKHHAKPKKHRLARL